MYYIYGSVWTIPTYRVYRLYDREGRRIWDTLGDALWWHLIESGSRTPENHPGKPQDNKLKIIIIGILDPYKAQTSW